MLQGWAIVENTSEEDWKDVRVVLVSGRPITFQMDLAQQSFMPRPKVDPEVYASLRPPTFAPALRGSGTAGRRHAAKRGNVESAEPAVIRFGGFAGQPRRNLGDGGKRPGW